MGVDVLVSDGFDVVSATELHELFLQDNQLFGSLSDESFMTTEEDDATFSSESPTKEAVEEWPDSQQVRSFYFVRHRPYDDPEIKAQIDQADKEIYKFNLARIQIANELKAKRAERLNLVVQLEILKAERGRLNAMVDEKKREAFVRQQSYDGDHLCSSEKELDDLIYNLQYRIQHESISLTEEKQLIKEIEQLEGTREMVRASSVTRAKVQHSLGETGVMQDQFKLMHPSIDEIEKGQQVEAKINRLGERLRAIKMEMESLGLELMGVINKRDKAFETIKTLRRQRDQRNAGFFQSLIILAKAKEMAANRNVKDLKELANSEVEKFMSLWNSDKAFRDDYEKRISPSLDARELSRDGHVRDSEEKLPVAFEASAGSGSSGVARAGSKRGREDSVSLSSQGSSAVSYKSEKEAGKKSKDFSKSTSEESDGMDLDIPRFEKPQNEEDIDDEKLKEKKREEELAKARQAMERKRRLQEKAAAKAAIRAQREVEKKLKDREKKAKKKAAAASSSPSECKETLKTVTEATEVEASSSLAKEKPKKERLVLPRHRNFRQRLRARGGDDLPKAIIKRRRASSYWVWTISCVAVSLVLFVVAYFYVH